MKKIIMNRALLTLAAVFSVLAVSQAVVQAHGTEAEHEHPTTTAIERKETAQANMAERKEQRVAKLEAKKLETCKKREAAINKKMSSIADRATKQLAVFTKISDRTQAFYTEKGRTLATYDTLVADVTAKRAAAETAAVTIKSTSVEFKCDGTDPKGAAASFKESQKTMNTALKEYKTSVKNLIVGVKSVNGKTQSSENKPAETTETNTGGTQ